MKKYIAPLFAIFIDIALHAFSPDSAGLRIFLQGFVYFSLFRILIFKTGVKGKVTNTLMKWTLGIGLVLPVVLIMAGLLVINQIYIADLVILVPILFYELMKEDNGQSKSDDLQNNSQMIDNNGNKNYNSD